MKRDSSFENGAERDFRYSKKFKALVTLSMLAAVGAIVAGNLRAEVLSKKRATVSFLAEVATLHHENAILYKDSSVKIREVIPQSLR